MPFESSRAVPTAASITATARTLEGDIEEFGSRFHGAVPTPGEQGPVALGVSRMGGCRCVR